MTQSGHSDQNHLGAPQRSPVHLKLTAERLILPVIKLRFGMIIKRIVQNISATDLSKARRFYGDILGLETGMDLGWIVTFTSSKEMTAPQVSIATEGGSGTAVPDLMVEVDDLDEAVHRILNAGFAPSYSP